MFKGYSSKSDLDKIQWIITFFQVILGNDEIKAKLALLTYDDAKLAIGKEKLEKLISKQHTKHKTMLNKETTHVSFITVYDEAKKEYFKIVDTADIIFKAFPEKYTQLGLGKAKSTKQLEIIDDMNVFCDIAINDDKILELLAACNFPKANIEKLFDNVKKAKQLYTDSSQEKNEYHSSVKGKKQNFTDMENYLKDLVNVVKIAFADDVEILSKLGL